MFIHATSPVVVFVSLSPVMLLTKANNHISCDEKLQRLHSSTTHVRFFVSHNAPSTDIYTLNVSPTFVSGEFIWYAISNFILPLRYNVIPFAPTMKLSKSIALSGSHTSSCVACLSSVMSVGGLIMPYQSDHQTII